MPNLGPSLAEWSLDTDVTTDMLNDIASFMKLLTTTTTKMNLNDRSTGHKERDERLSLSTAFDNCHL